MQTRVVRIPHLFAADTLALVNGFSRIVSHIVTAPIERVAEACDVAGLMAARRADRQAGAGLYRAAARDGHRSRRRARSGCFHYLSQLT